MNATLDLASTIDTLTKLVVSQRGASRRCAPAPAACSI